MVGGGDDSASADEHVEVELAEHAYVLLHRQPADEHLAEHIIK